MRGGKPILESETNEELEAIQGAKKIIDLLNKESLISSLITNCNWSELFTNDNWLSVLEMAQNLNSLEAGIISKELETIATFFPEETKGYIFVDILY